MATEVREGLTSSPKSLSPKYFYDDRGSDLLEQITGLPEYYLSRAEQEGRTREVDAGRMSLAGIRDQAREHTATIEAAATRMRDAPH